MTSKLMLGFNAISETAIAEQPGVTLFLDNQNLGSTTAINAVGIETTGAVSVDSQNLAMTMTLGGNFTVTGSAVISVTGFSTTLSQGNVLIWGEIPPGVTTTYTNITTGASQTWTEISTGASQTWTEI